MVFSGVLLVLVGRVIRLLFFVSLFCWCSGSWMIELDFIVIVV